MMRQWWMSAASGKGGPGPAVGGFALAAAGVQQDAGYGAAVGSVDAGGADFVARAMDGALNPLSGAGGMAGAGADGCAPAHQGRNYR